jgi:hypothetical protein
VRNNGADCSDTLWVFSATRSGRARNVRLRPLDAYAVLTLADGTTRGQELYYGSTYLSQSSRYLNVPRDVVRVIVYDSRGRGRALPN